MEPIVLCLKDIDPSLVVKNPDGVKEALIQAIGVNPKDVVDIDIVETNKPAIYLTFRKPKIVDPKVVLFSLPKALAEQAELDNVTIEDASKNQNLFQKTFDPCVFQQ